MKKKILASILSAGMLVSLMAGCGSNAAETDNEVQSGGTEKSSDRSKAPRLTTQMMRFRDLLILQMALWS